MASSKPQILQELSENPVTINIVSQSAGSPSPAASNQVKPSDSEGECKIINIMYLELNFFKIVLTAIAILCTGGVFLLFCYWSSRLFKFCFFSHSTLVDCQYIFITNFDFTYSFAKKMLINSKEFFSCCSRFNSIQFPQQRIRTTSSDESSQYTYAFRNRHQLYVYSAESGQFSVLEYPITRMTPAQISSSTGLTGQETIEASRNLFGQCIITFPIPNILQFFFQEFFKPFYMLLFFSIILWFIEGYPIFSINMIWTSVLVNFILYLFVRSSKKRLLSLAFNETKIRIARSGQSLINKINANLFTEHLSRELLPGDIFIVERQKPVPCDCILISGQVLVNESSMTGEIVPVPKFQIDKLNDSELFIQHKFASNILYDGSIIVNTMPKEHEYILAMAIRTGFSSVKGQIIRGLLYPQPLDGSFFRQGIVFMFTLITFGLVGYIVTLDTMKSYNMSLKLILFKLGDAFIYIMPPALPIVLSLCLISGLWRLGFKNIMGQDPGRLLLAGKVKTICFDKTGTLTNDKIEVSGYLMQDLSQIYNESHRDKQINGIVYKILASCHQSQMLDGVLLGDTIDIAGLNYSGWSYEQAEQKQPYLFIARPPPSDENIINSIEIHQIFEFHSDQQSLSVVVRESLTNNFYVYMKGSPEKIKLHCVPSSIPPQYEQSLNSLTIQGYRVIALAHKQIQKDQVGHLQRQEAESEVYFAGFLILHNNLKSDTSKVIQHLQQAQFNIKIISGDNLLTVVHAACQAAIVDPLKKTILIDCDCDYESKQFSMGEGIGSLIISILDNSLQKIDKPNVDDLINWVEENALDQNSNEYNLSLSGKAMNYLMLKSSQNERIQHFFKRLLAQTQVFGRCKPDQKAHVIKELKGQNTKVAMVGDGANDCAAIREADVGISFSQTDAAISAPFISKDPSISCVEKVLLEGRANICSSYEIYQFYTTSGFIRYMGLLIMTYNATVITDFQNNYIAYYGGVIIIIICWTWSRPAEYISNANINSNLLSKANAVSMYGRLGIIFSGQVATYFYLTRSSIYEGNHSLAQDNWYVLRCQENTVVFQSLVLFITFNAFAIYTSEPIKEKIYKNIVLIIVLTINLIYNIVTTIFPKIGFKGMELVDLTTEFRIILILIICATGFATYLFEWFVVKKMIQKY